MEKPWIMNCADVKRDWAWVEKYHGGSLATLPNRFPERLNHSGFLPIVIKVDDDSRYLWFNPSSLDNPEAKEEYRTCGIVIGLAVFNNMDGLDIHFPLVFFRKLKNEPVGLKDLEEFRPSLWHNLNAMLSWEPSDKNATTAEADEEFENIFCVDFTVTYEFFGEAKIHELKPGGADIPVNTSNRTESIKGLYANLYADFLLNKSVEPQFLAFADGFQLVVDEAFFALLQSEEIYKMVCAEQNLDFEDLRKGARYENYDPEDEEDKAYLDMFWEILLEFDLDEKKKFLTFVTGSEISPLGGLHELRLMVQKNGVEPCDRLPSAHTCFNVLLLPVYGSREKLKRLLFLAIENSEGFGLQ